MLLVYDGADDLSFLPKVLPRLTARVHVVVTTRCEHHSVLQKVTHVISLARLEKEDAVSALTTWSGRQSSTLNDDERVAATKLSIEPPIESLPIALAHAGTYVRKADVGYEEYYKKLKTEEDNLKALALDLENLLHYFKAGRLHEELLNSGVIQPTDLEKLTDVNINELNIENHEKAVIKKMRKFMSSSHAHLTWQMDIELVARDHPKALSLLEYASFLSSRDIPEKLVRPLVFGECANYEYSLCVSTLSSHNLIEWHETTEGYTLNIHPLVQSTVMERVKSQPPDEMKRKLSKLCKMFLSQLPDSGSKHILYLLGDEGFQSLSAHLYTLAKNVLLTGVVTSICLNVVRRACGFALFFFHVDTALYLSEKLYPVVKRLHEKSEKDTLIWLVDGIAAAIIGDEAITVCL